MSPQRALPAYKYKRLIKYDEFVQRVRRHPRTELLAMLGKVAAEVDAASVVGEGERFQRQNLHPFALAAAAREAVLKGNDHRRGPVTRDDVREICGAYMAVDDLPQGDVWRFLVAVAYEQFVFQARPMQELARSQALLVTAAEAYGSEIITPSFWEGALGCSLRDFVGTSFLLWVGAQRNEGRYDPGWLDQENFKPVLDEIPRASIEEATDRHFLGTIEELRALMAGRIVPAGASAKRSFNPLQARPFVAMPDGHYLAPQAAYVRMRATPTGLYYIGVQHGGHGFTDELGHVFEHYVGMQLGQLGLPLHPEIVYEVSGQERKSVDWMLELPDLTLLVEAKSTPITEAGRLGLDRYAEDLERTITKAHDQIATTAGLIREEHPTFAHLPHDRPIAGLVVTLEPYFMAATSFGPGQEPVEPTLHASAAELELAVRIGLDGRLNECLKEIVNDEERRTWGLGPALGPQDGESLPPNPLIDEAWAVYPFWTAHAD